MYTLEPGKGSVWVRSCSGRMAPWGMFHKSLYEWAEDTGATAGWFVANQDEVALARFPELSR